MSKPRVEVLRREDYVVKKVSIARARILVEAFHYAASATKTGVYTHGLFKVGMESDEQCLGVAWWLPPTKNAAAATHPDWRRVLSLTRLVVHPLVPQNGASFLLMGSVKLIDKTKWVCLVTYADTWQNHTGAIYKACNWEYMGMTAPSPVWQNEEGRVMGAKRGRTNLTASQMKELGFNLVGKFSKHKYRLIL